LNFNLAGANRGLTFLVHDSQTRDQALKHYGAKVDYIRTNLEALEETIQKKRDNMNYLINVMQAKLQAQTQATTKP